MQTMQQQRAEFALRMVVNAKKRIEEEKHTDGDKKLDPKEFKSYAEAFPAMIRMNGLGQAAAFYFSKGEGKKGNAAYEALYKLLSEWLTGTLQPYNDYKSLLGGITEADMEKYRLAQVEALMLLDWVKKFAKVYMEDE